MYAVRSRSRLCRPVQVETLHTFIYTTAVPGIVYSSSRSQCLGPKLYEGLYCYYEVSSNRFIVVAAGPYRDRLYSAQQGSTPRFVAPATTVLNLCNPGLCCCYYVQYMYSTTTKLPSALTFGRITCCIIDFLSPDLSGNVSYTLVPVLLESNILYRSSSRLSSITLNQ